MPFRRCFFQRSDARPGPGVRALHRSVFAAALCVIPVGSDAYDHRPLYDYQPTVSCAFALTTRTIDATLRMNQTVAQFHTNIFEVLGSKAGLGVEDRGSRCP